MAETTVERMNILPLVGSNGIEMSGKGCWGRVIGENEEPAVFPRGMGSPAWRRDFSGQKLSLREHIVLGFNKPNHHPRGTQAVNTL